MNAQDLVIDRILAALNGAPAIAQGNISEERTRPLGQNVNEAVIVRFAGSTPNRNSMGAGIDWTTTVNIEHHARGDARTPSGRASRILTGIVFARLMADPSLGGVLMDLRPPRLAADQSQSLDDEMGCVIAQYTALHRSASNTLEAIAP
jgi:hypothetical protein